MNRKTSTRKIRALEAALIHRQEKLAVLERRQPREPVAQFCAARPLFALLAAGVDGWEPKYRY